METLISILAVLWYAIGALYMAYIFNKNGKMTNGDMIACAFAGILGPIGAIIVFFVYKKMIVDSDYAIDEMCECGKKMTLKNFSIDMIEYECECGNKRKYI